MPVLAILRALLLLAVVARASGQSGGGYGLESPEPVAPYLNGAFPASTPGADGAPQPPAKLSATGAFANLASLTPAVGLLPYDVNAPLWTDGALKRRWIAVPNDGVHNSAGERIGFSATEPWVFPVGTVIVKHFELRVNDGNPAAIRRLETRFLVHGIDGYYGVTYRWRPDHSDADLLLRGESGNVVMTRADGSLETQTWSYPSRADCMGCHNASAGHVLGLRTWQLNGDLRYPETGRTDNQLRALNHLGIFSPALDESQIGSYLRSHALDDTTATLETRVRSYLASNCAHCHRPGVTNAFFDARYDVPLAQQGMINGAVLYSQGIDGAHVIRPQSIAQSIMHLRMNTLGPESMPPIGKNVIHTEAVAMLEQWIESLPADAGSGNHAPAALDDSALTAFESEVVIDLLANDSDPDGDPLVVVNLTQPGRGIVNQSGGGVVTFTPPAGFSGEVTFTYQADDGAGGVSAVAIVTVTVAARPTATGLTFRDGTSSLPGGAVHSGVAMGIADMNGDGRDDLVRLSGGREVLIETQQANGGFSHYSMGFAFGVKQWGIAIADTNRDGMSEFVTGGYYDGLKLFRANASATAWTPSDLPGPTLFLQAINFADIDNDGRLDIFACHDDAESHKFRGDAAGGFTLAPGLIDTTAPPSDHSGNYGSVWTDYDGDGDIDLYISKCRAGVADPADRRRVNKLMRNNGDGTFSDVAAAAGIAFGEQSWAADFADVDNDGDLDCFVANHSAPSYLMRNDGDGTFTNVTATSGISVNYAVVQVAFRDFDNDGWVDLLLTGSQHRLYRNDGDGTFTLNANLFTADPIESCAVGDLDHDGFVDVYAGYARLYNQPGPTADRLFLNAGNDNHYLAVQLEGTTSNRQGIGARVELAGTWGRQVREVRAGESFGVTYSRTAHFGMGAQPMASSLKVFWPSGAVDTLSGVAGNRYLTIREGSTAPPSMQVPGTQYSVVGDAVTLAIVATDPTGDALTFTARGLPDGLTMHPQTATITGTLTTASVGTHSCMVSASDAHSTVTAPFVWNVEPDRTVWTQWQQFTPGAGGTPASNTDGDVFDDLMEFALGSPPDRAAGVTEGLQLEAAAGAVSAWFARPEGVRGVTWTLQKSLDMASWSDVTRPPRVTASAGGLLRVEHAELQAEPGLSPDEGYLRLKVTLGSPAATSYSLPVGWKTTRMGAGYATHSAVFVHKAVYSGRIASQGAASLTSESGSVSGRLDAGGRHYLELVSGAHEGHRFDLAPAGSPGAASGIITLDLASRHNTLAALPAGLAGSRFVVRRHLTVGDVYPPRLFHGGRDPATVDQLQFFAPGGYETLFLLDIGDGSPAHWTSSANAQLADAGGRILPPGSACFVRRMRTTVSIPCAGEVRVNRFAQPLTAGINMVGAPHPRDHSPASRKLLLADGYRGDPNPAKADQLQCWLGDRMDGAGSASGFESYFLLDTGVSSPYRYWVEMGSAALHNENDTSLFKRDRAAFIRCATDHRNYVVPAVAYP